MERSRVTTGELVAAVSGAVLVLLMFVVKWFGEEIAGSTAGTSGDYPGTSRNAWQAFDFIDILLFLAAAAAVTMAILRANGNMPALPWPPALIVAAAGAVAVLLILYRIIDPPGPADEATDIEGTRKVGAFLGLIAAGGIAYGGWMALREREAPQRSGRPATRPRA